MKQVLTKMMSLFQAKLDPLMETAQENMKTITTRFEALESRAMSPYMHEREIVVENRSPASERSGSRSPVDRVRFKNPISEVKPIEINNHKPKQELIHIRPQVPKIRATLALPNSIHSKIQSTRDRRLAHMRLYHETEPCDAIETYF
jgi:hypothetical protein